MKKPDFNKFLEKMKELNPKEIYAWPFNFQLFVGFLVSMTVLIVGIFMHLMPKGEEVQAVIKKEDKLKEEFLQKKKQAVNLTLYQEQLQEITKDSDNLLKQLPNKSEMEKLLIDINQAGTGRGLQFELFKPEKEKMNDFYAELPINIKVSGTYDAIGNFTADVAQLSRVVLFTDMEIGTKNGSVIFNTTAKTFRYLDQDELDMQKAAKAERLKKKNAKANAPAAKKEAGGH